MSLCIHMQLNDLVFEWIYCVNFPLSCTMAKLQNKTKIYKFQNNKRGNLTRVSFGQKQLRGINWVHFPSFSGTYPGTYVPKPNLRNRRIGL